MTVPSTTCTTSAVMNGVTTLIPVPFRFLEDSHLAVTKYTIATGAEEVLVLNSDYTVDGAGENSGGSITLATAYSSLYRVDVKRDIPILQLMDYVVNDPFPAESHERGLDLLTMICQQLQSDLALALAELDLNGVDLTELIENLLVNQDFLDLLTQLITNTFDETDYILQLGMLRYLIPIKSIAGTTATVDKTYESALTRCTNALATTVTIRANTGDTDADFSTGSFMSFKQTTVGGQVTIVAPAGGTLAVPTGFLAKTRALNSIITVTCELASGGTWTISGDLAVDPSASSGQACTTLASAAGVVTVDCSLGDFFVLNLTENVTSWVFQNLPASGFAQHLRLRINQHASSPKTVAWPASLKWVGGAPVVSNTNGAVDYLSMTTFDQGTRWESALSKGFA